jgi:hypothetical protein
VSRILPPDKKPVGAKQGYFYVEWGPGLRFIEAKYYADALRPVLTYDEFLQWLKYLQFPTVTLKKKVMVDMCRLEAVLSGLSRSGQPDHVAGQTVIDAEKSDDNFEAVILELHALKLSDGLDRSKALRQRLKDATAQAQSLLRSKGSSRVFSNPSPTKLSLPNSPTPTQTTRSFVKRESTSPNKG